MSKVWLDSYGFDQHAYYRRAYRPIFTMRDAVSGRTKIDETVVPKALQPSPREQNFSNESNIDLS